VTYQYLHASGSHIFWNMLSVYFIVPIMERTWGWRRTLIFYTVGGVVAGLFYAAMSYLFGEGFLVGASGSILAVLGAMAAIMPGLMFFGVIPVRILVLLYAVLYILTITHDRSLSDAAHLGGLAFGFVAPLVGGGNFVRDWADRLQAHRKQGLVRAEQAEQAAIDRILAKVHDHGMNSLSRSERNTLKRATERQRQSDAKRARRVH
jgi:membrane associated rhomboid family serine protease